MKRNDPVPISVRMGKFVARFRLMRIDPAVRFQRIAARIMIWISWIAVFISIVLIPFVVILSYPNYDRFSTILVLITLPVFAVYFSAIALALRYQLYVPVMDGGVEGNVVEVLEE